ncbi:MAG: tetratricopeptide repeat protein [bacterium]|nr:tetratricopeptide repeat protein [bacterium]
MESRDHTLETLNEYLGPEERAAGAPSGSQQPAGGSEQLPQEWEIEESISEDAISEDDILQRLDRIEKRLDAFENTAYTFLLYAKQLTDRTASFFEDIFGLSRTDIAQIHDRLGVNYNNKGDYPRAIDAFRKLVELQRTASSCFKLGVAYDNNGDFQEAIESYRASISLDSSYLKAYYKLAEVYARTQNFGEAIRGLTQAAEIDQDNPETHFRLGNVHSARGSYDQAIASFNRVLALDSAYSGIYQSLGLAYEQKGEHNKAIEFFKKSI